MSNTDSRSAAGGALIVNADDWGQDRRTTDCIFDCMAKGSVTATSAMVFMEDSERAAALAREHAIDAGLHLNFTAPFTAAARPAALVEPQRRVTAYLRKHRLAQLVFNPALVSSFEYIVKSQIDEYRRLYGVNPARLDGHHHMHLCANVLLQRLLPNGTRVRRNFSFQPGEKSIVNRSYRRLVDSLLRRRHRLVDHLFSIEPLQSLERLDRILLLSHQHVVELETHPVRSDEYAFLMSGSLERRRGEFRPAGPQTVPIRTTASDMSNNTTGASQARHVEAGDSV